MEIAAALLIQGMWRLFFPSTVKDGIILYFSQSFNNAVMILQSPLYAAYGSKVYYGNRIIAFAISIQHSLEVADTSGRFWPSPIY